jgi:hypothetical protein
MKRVSLKYCLKTPQTQQMYSHSPRASRDKGERGISGLEFISRTRRRIQSSESPCFPLVKGEK